jgi:hypothetical protein
MQEQVKMRANNVIFADRLVPKRSTLYSRVGGTVSRIFSPYFFLPAQVFLVLVSATAGAFETNATTYDYRVLATSRTSTMEKEMNEAGSAGYGFMGVMGGETGVGGKEVVVVMGKRIGADDSVLKKYKLLATQRTSTMQKEMQQAGDEGFEYLGQTVFESAFGGKEVTIILERALDRPARHVQYKLLATTKTSTMQKELNQAGEQGFEFLGMTVGKTSFGGDEVVSLLRKPAD